MSLRQDNPWVSSACPRTLSEKWNGAGVCQFVRPSVLCLPDAHLCLDSADTEARGQGQAQLWSSCRRALFVRSVWRSQDGDWKARSRVTASQCQLELKAQRDAGESLRGLWGLGH